MPTSPPPPPSSSSSSQHRHQQLGPPPPPWPSIQACLKELIEQGRITDHGSFTCSDAYHFLYTSVEAAAHEEETPPELQFLLREQGPDVIGHIMIGLRQARLSLLESAVPASNALPLLTVLLNDGPCCRLLAETNRTHEVLEVLVDLVQRAQELLNDDPPPSSSSSSSASPTAAGAGAGAGAAAAGNTRALEAHLLSLADVSFHALNTLTHQRCNLALLPEDLVIKIMTILRLAVEGRFGELARALPAQGLQACVYLLPRLAANPGCAGEARGLLKAILKRVLVRSSENESEGDSGAAGAGEKSKKNEQRKEGGEQDNPPPPTIKINTEEISMALRALSLAETTVPLPLLIRDPSTPPAPCDGTYSNFIRENFDEQAFLALAQIKLPLALQVAERVLKLLSPAGLQQPKLMESIYKVVQNAMQVQEQEKEKEKERGGGKSKSSLTKQQQQAQQQQQHRAAIRRQALEIWTLYIERLWQDWEEIVTLTQAKYKNRATRVEATFALLMQNLVSPVQFLFHSSPPGGEYQREIDSKALRLLNTLLSKPEWQQYLWPTYTLTHTQTQTNTTSIQTLLLHLLATRHNPHGSDPAQLRFDAALCCLSHLVPGAIPPHLLKRDAASRGWKKVPPLDPSTTQWRLLTHAIQMMAAQPCVATYYHTLYQQRQQHHQKQQQQQDQSPSLLSSHSFLSQSQTSALPPPPPPPPTAVRAILTAWTHLLHHLLPPVLRLDTKENTHIHTHTHTHTHTPPIPAPIIDEAFAILRKAGLPQELLHTLADEALSHMVTSERLFDAANSKLWQDVRRKVYTPPPPLGEGGGGGGEGQGDETHTHKHTHTTAPLGVLLLGLKALLLRPSGGGGEEEGGGVCVGVSVPLPHIPLQQLVPLLEGLLRRLTEYDDDIKKKKSSNKKGEKEKENVSGGVSVSVSVSMSVEVPTPNPFLRLYCGVLARVIAGVNEKKQRAQAEKKQKEKEKEKKKKGGLNGKEEKATSTTTTTTMVEIDDAQVIAILAMLPRFAVCLLAGVAFRSPEALQQAAGGFIIQQWGNLLSACLEASGGIWGGGRVEEEEKEDSLGMMVLCRGEREDPVGKVRGLLEVVEAMLLVSSSSAGGGKEEEGGGAGKKRKKKPPQQQQQQPSQPLPRVAPAALAVIWCPLAQAYLRSINTILLQVNKQTGPQQQQQQRGGEGREDLYGLYTKYAVKTTTRLLQVLQEATTVAVGKSSTTTTSNSTTTTTTTPQFCLCGACPCGDNEDGKRRKSNNNSMAMTSNKKWLSSCLKPAPFAWDPQLLAEVAKALASWWGGVCVSSQEGAAAAVSPCRAGLMVEVKRITERLFTSLASGSGSGGEKAASGGAAGAAAAAAARRFSSSSVGGGGASSRPSSPTFSEILKAPMTYLRALQPLLLVLVDPQHQKSGGSSNGGSSNGKEDSSFASSVLVWWRVSGLGRVADLGLEEGEGGGEAGEGESGHKLLLEALRSLVAKGLIQSKDKQLLSSSPQQEGGGGEEESDPAFVIDKEVRPEKKKRWSGGGGAGGGTGGSKGGRK